MTTTPSTNATIGRWVWMLAVAASVLLLANCANAQPASHFDERSATATSVAAASAAAQVQVVLDERVAKTTSLAAAQVQVVLDTSASVPAEYKLDALRALAAVSRNWPHTLPSTGASAAQPGLILQVRGVGADSYAPESLLGTWDVRGIPAVASLPTTVTADFTQRVLQYKKELKAAQRAYRGAVADARRTALGLSSLHPKTTYASEIQGAVSAAAQSFGPSGMRRLIVVSDLAQNRPPEIAGSLRGIQVLIGHVCWKVSTCQSEERVWSRTLRSRGATSVEFVRIERFPTAVATFMKGA